MGKCQVVIAGSVDNDFEPSEKLTDRPLERNGVHRPRERA